MDRELSADGGFWDGIPDECEEAAATECDDRALLDEEDVDVECIEVLDKNLEVFELVLGDVLLSSVEVELLMIVG